HAALLRGTDAAVAPVRIHHAAAGRVIDRGMATAPGGRARIRRAGIAVVAVRGRAVAAVPTAAGLLAVADVAVRARGAVRLVDVLAAGVGIARVLGAGVAVVAVDGVADAGAAVAALVDGAETRVGALVVAGAGLPAGREHEDEGEDERRPEELSHVVISGWFPPSAERSITSSGLTYQPQVRAQGS